MSEIVRNFLITLYCPHACKNWVSDCAWRFREKSQENRVVGKWFNGKTRSTCSPLLYTFIENAVQVTLENLYDPEVSVRLPRNKLYWRFQRQEVAGISHNHNNELHVNFICSTLIHWERAQIQVLNNRKDKEIKAFQAKTTQIKCKYNQVSSDVSYSKAKVLHVLVWWNISAEAIQGKFKIDHSRSG